MDDNAKLSIVDVAKRAGVSTATVSRVINHNGGYSRETEEKVRRTIEECGFTPNANAIGLRTNKSRCIGVIVPDVTNEFFAKIIQELDFYLLKHGYSLLICNSNEDYELDIPPVMAAYHNANDCPANHDLWRKGNRMKSRTSMKSGIYPWFTLTAPRSMPRC